MYISGTYQVQLYLGMYLIARMIRVDDSVGNMFNSFFFKKPTSFTMRLTIFNAYELSVNINAIHFNGFK